MIEVTKFGGGETAGINDQLVVEEAKHEDQLSSSAYQMVWIKNLQKQITALEARVDALEP